MEPAPVRYLKGILTKPGRGTNERQSNSSQRLPNESLPFGAVQLNGRIRHTIAADAEMGTDTLLALVKTDRRVKELLAGKQIVKEIAVPGRLVNFVVRE